MEKTIYEKKGKIVSVTITTNEENDYILMVKVWGFIALTINLNDIFQHLREWKKN